MFSTKFKIYAGVGMLSAGVMAFSVSAQRSHDDAEKAYVAAHRVAPEIIQTKGLLPAYGQRAHRLSDFWVHAETDDWILLNGARGTNTCPSVLGAFGAVNAPGQAMSLSAVRLLASGYEGGRVKLSVLVPRFKSAPAGLSSCAGMAYDQKTGQLRVGSKYVAYLAPSQPQLANLPR